MILRSLHHALGGEGQHPFFAFAPVEGARTVECIDELVRDRAQFEDGIREVGFGRTRFIDLDGRVRDR